MIFILIGSYLVLNVFDGSILLANGTTFAAAVGAVLIYSPLCITGESVSIILIVWSNLITDRCVLGKMYEIIAYKYSVRYCKFELPIICLVDQFT